MRDGTGRADRLRTFIGSMADVVATASSEASILHDGSELLGDLVAADNWLPEQFARPRSDRYQQYLLHCDSRQRFSVVSFVWAPGQSTPVHDHTTWGLIGVLRGAERATGFVLDESGAVPARPPQLLERGAVDAVSPTIGDLHQVENAKNGEVSISIHVYGADIGAVERSVYRPNGTSTRFVSGYSNDVLPNIWGRDAPEPALATSNR